MQPKRLPSFMTTQVKLKTPLKGDIRASSPSTTPQQSARPQHSTRLSRKNVVLLLVVITLVLLVFIGPQFGFSAFELWFNNDLSLAHANIEPVSGDLIPVAQTSSFLEEGAFVFVAIGSEGYHMKCSAAIDSLTRHAGWAGDVYVIYDNPSCFSEELLLKESGIKRERLHLMRYNQSHTHSLRGKGSDDDGQSGTFFADIFDDLGERNILPDNLLKWRLKSRLFEVISDPKIKVIASIDCDTLFAIEGCASALIAKVLDWKATDKNLMATTVRTDESGAVTELALGTFLVHREHSRMALAAWGASIDKGQVSYVKTMSEVAARLKPGELNYMSVGFINNDNDPFEQNDISHNLACINHISRETCDFFGRENVQKFIDKFGLSAYEKYTYCPHPIIRSVLGSSWIPFHLLPGCPKLDQYL